MLKKTKFWVHCVLATAFIFGFMFVAGKLFTIFDFLDPIGDALEGYEMTDQVFSNDSWRVPPPVEENIVIVNLGLPSAGATRRVTAEQINIINSFGPKVIGLDAIFRNLMADTLGDLMLADALANSSNVIMSFIEGMFTFSESVLEFSSRVDFNFSICFTISST